MSIASVAVPVALCACAWLYAWIKLRLMAECRETLRPVAERVAIERRWLERWSRSRAEFGRRWDAELRQLRLAHVPRRSRWMFGLGDVARALDAELACLLNQEIGCWTFADRTCRSQDAFERLSATCLARLGWNVGAPVVRAHRILSKAGVRVAVRFHFGEGDAECLDIEAIARTARREGCDAACVITNGRTRGATRVFAEAFDVAVLHWSQLDRLDGVPPAPSIGRPAERLALAA